MIPPVITRIKPIFPALPVSFLLYCLAGYAHAEGAVRIFSCDLEQICDGSGICERETGEVEFRMEPIQLDESGAGTYQLTYEDNEIAMQAISDAGPFIWSVADQSHTLLVNSETRLLWHSLSFDSGLVSSTRFLQCTLQQ